LGFQLPRVGCIVAIEFFIFIFAFVFMSVAVRRRRRHEIIVFKSTVESKLGSGWLRWRSGRFSITVDFYMCRIERIKRRGGSSGSGSGSGSNMW
jgi:hypothetical protein